MPSRAEVREMYEKVRSWRKVGSALGVTAAVAWRYAKTDYLPKRPDLLKALEQPKPTTINQLRGPDGQFISQKKHE